MTPNPSHDSSRARDGREYLSLDSVVVAGAAGERPASPERPLVDRVRDAFRDYTDANALTDRGEVVWRAGMAARSAKFEHIVRGITHIIERWPTDDDPVAWAGLRCAGAGTPVAPGTTRTGRSLATTTPACASRSVSGSSRTGLPCSLTRRSLRRTRRHPGTGTGSTCSAWSFVRADFDRLWRYIARGAEAAGHERNWRAARDRYIASSPTALPLEGDPSLVEQFVIDDAIYVRKEQVDAEMDRFRTLCMEEANNSPLCMEYDRHRPRRRPHDVLQDGPAPGSPHRLHGGDVHGGAVRHGADPTSDEDAIAQARRTNRDWVGRCRRSPTRATTRTSAA